MSKIRKLFTKKRVLVTVGVLLLLIIAAAGGVISAQFFKGPAKITSENQTASGLPKEIDELQSLRSEGNTEEANKKIDEGLNDPGASNNTKYMLYIQKGHSSFEAKDYKAALTSYAEASKLKETSDVFVLIGESNFALGDKAAAKTAYQKAIALLDPNSPISKSTETDLQQRIDIIDGKAQP